MLRAIQMYCRQTFACFEEMMPSSRSIPAHFHLSLHGANNSHSCSNAFLWGFVSTCGAIGFTPLDFVFAHLKARDDSVQFKAPASGNCHQHRLASALSCGHCSSCR
ncbi:uncharacterized protein LOC116023977 [Ipomoea triloba]|uniref:uncharacterized protein LOC116023977 n=1 Tax=Ipomoea triloba TaxID=35885 RepID=UPI00125CDDBE|nr:uncharacterized protein LOC116023977 [Ipomoea triloba]